MNPAKVMPVPKGWSQNAVETPTPSSASPTAQDGAAQQTTHIMVMLVNPMRVAPSPVAAKPE